MKLASIEPPTSFVDAVSLLHSRLPGANWETQPHITLSHFGDIVSTTVEEVLSVLSSVSFEPFELQAHRLGVFGDADSASVVWLGFETSTELESLHAQLSDVRSRFVSFPDRHSFNPHLTLARTNECDSDAVNQYLDAGLAGVKLDPFRVDSFGLFESNNFEYKSIADFHAAG